MDKAIARFLSPTQFFVKNVFRQETIDSLQKFVAHPLARHQSRQFGCPGLPKLYHTPKCFCATRTGMSPNPCRRTLRPPIRPSDPALNWPRTPPLGYLLGSNPRLTAKITDLRRR